MGIIKFEVEIPDFESELNINVTLKKDGVVVDSMSTTSSPSIREVPATKSVEKKEKKKSETSSKKSVSSLLGSGNMMNLEDF